MKKVYIFGASLDGKEMIDRLKPLVWLGEIEIVGLVDNDPSLWGREIMGYRVDSPEQLAAGGFDWVVITPIFDLLIRERLLEVGVPEEKIRSQYTLPHFGLEQRQIDSVQIGRYSYYKGHSVLKDCIIGDFTCMGDNVTIGLGTHAIENVTSYPLHIRFMRQYGTNKSGRAANKTVIGSDVYIGEGAVINKGVSVGHGAVIAARAVVSKDVPPYAVVGGIPAKLIKYRFPEEIIERLLAISWWSWPDSKIQENIDAFYEPIEEFVNRFGSAGEMAK